MQQRIRRAGGLLVMTIPRIFIEQNRLKNGSRVDLVMSGRTLSVTASERNPLRLADLIAQASADLRMVEGWDRMTPVGKEIAE